MSSVSELSTEIEYLLQQVLSILKCTCLSYTAAWDLSVGLCSLCHSGELPCFMPLDFCEATPARSAGEMDLVLKDNCPALHVYNLYHSLRVNLAPHPSISLNIENFSLVPHGKNSSTSTKRLASFDNPWLEETQHSHDGQLQPQTENADTVYLSTQTASLVLDLPNLLLGSDSMVMGDILSEDFRRQHPLKLKPSFFIDKGKCKWELQLINEFVNNLGSVIDILNEAIQNHPKE